MNTLDMTVKTVGDAYVILLKGSANNETSSMLQQGITEAVRSGHSRVIVDGSELLMVTSAGLRCFLNGARAMESAGGTFLLAGLVPRVENLLALTGLAQVLKIRPSVAAALAD